MARGDERVRDADDHHHLPLGQQPGSDGRDRVFPFLAAQGDDDVVDRAQQPQLHHDCRQARDAWATTEWASKLVHYLLHFNSISYQTKIVGASATR